MAGLGDLGPNSTFIGGHFAITSDENRGGIGLLIKRTQNMGGSDLWESISSGAPVKASHKWRNHREKVTVSENFRAGDPWTGRHILSLHLVTPLPATGIPIFTAIGKSYRIVSVRESHNVAESTAATLNCQVLRAQGTEAASGANILLEATSLPVKGAANTVDGMPDGAGWRQVSVFESTILEEGDRLLVAFAVDAETLTATTEYEGNVTIVVEPIDQPEGDEVLLEVPLTAATDLATTGVTVFHSPDRAYQVTNIEEVHTVAEASAATANLKVERCQATEAATAGDDLLGATAINLKAAANTAQAGTLVTTGNRDILAAGDRLVVHAALDNETAQALSEYAGTISIRLVPVVEPVTEEIIRTVSFQDAVAATGVPIFQAIGKRYRVTDIAEVHTVAESTATTANLKIERCQSTEAATAGDDLVTATAINVKAAANTVINVTPTKTSDVHILEDGDRLVAHFADDAEGAIATTEYDGNVTIRLEPIPAAGPLKLGQLFQADGKAYKVSSAEATWGRAEVQQTECNLRIERLQGTEAPGAGDIVHTITDVDMTGAVNTPTPATILSSGVEILADGNRLGCLAADDGGLQVAPSQLDDVNVTVKLLGQADGIEPAKEGSFWDAIGRSWKLVNVVASWTTAESTASECNLIIERLQGTEAPGAASGGAGDRVVGLADFDCTGAANTVNTGTPVTTSSVDVFAAGDRAAINFVDDAGTTTVVPTELDGLEVTLYFVPVTLEAKATS